MALRRYALTVAVLLLAACRSTDLPENLPAEEQIPASATAVYRIVPELLIYDFTDSTGGQRLRLSWLSIPQQTLFGHNCIALSPTSPGATIGTFVFVARGPNQGYLERTTPTLVDTVVGYFIGSGQGSRGSYVISPQQQVTLTWANGTPLRYFDPAATLRISGDSLIADADLTAAADSIHATWHVVWVLDQC